MKTSEKEFLKKLAEASAIAEYNHQMSLHAQDELRRIDLEFHMLPDKSKLDYYGKRLHAAFAEFALGEMKFTIQSERLRAKANALGIPKRIIEQTIQNARKSKKANPSILQFRANELRTETVRNAKKKLLDAIKSQGTTRREANTLAKYAERMKEPTHKLPDRFQRFVQTRNRRRLL